MLSQAPQGSAWTLRADPCDAPVPEVMPCSLLSRCRDRGCVCKAPPLQSEGTRVHTHAADRTLQAQEGAGPLLQSTLPATATQTVHTPALEKEGQAGAARSQQRRGQCGGPGRERAAPVMEPGERRMSGGAQRAKGGPQVRGREGGARAPGRESDRRGARTATHGSAGISTPSGCCSEHGRGAWQREVWGPRRRPRWLSTTRGVAVAVTLEGRGCA